MQYVNTVLVSSIGAFNGIKPGQWIQIETGSRGQYLGKTKAGANVIRWQSEQSKFARVDAKANKPLRQFAKLYGSK